MHQHLPFGSSPFLVDSLRSSWLVFFFFPVLSSFTMAGRRGVAKAQRAIPSLGDRWKKKGRDMQNLLLTETFMMFTGSRTLPGRPLGSERHRRRPTVRVSYFISLTHQSDVSFSITQKNFPNGPTSPWRFDGTRLFENRIIKLRKELTR